MSAMLNIRSFDDLIIKLKLPKEKAEATAKQLGIAIPVIQVEEPKKPEEPEKHPAEIRLAEFINENRNRFFALTLDKKTINAKPKKSGIRQAGFLWAGKNNALRLFIFGHVYNHQIFYCPSDAKKASKVLIEKKIICKGCGNHSSKTANEAGLHKTGHSSRVYEIDLRSIETSINHKSREESPC